MFVPLSVILGLVIWMFMAWVKLRIAKGHKTKFSHTIDDKVLENILKSTGGSKKSTEEALEILKKRRQAEEEAKIKKTEGKSFFEEFDERRKGEGQKKRREYDPDMFHDPISRLYHNKAKDDKKTNDTKSNDTKTKTEDDEKMEAAALFLQALQKEVRPTTGNRCRRDD